MRSTMMDIPLTITSIMRYGTAVFGDSEVVTCTGDGTRRRTLRRDRRAAARLANALRGLGVRRRPAGRHVHVEQRRAPRGVPRDPVDGRGAAHAQHPALPRRRSSTSPTTPRTASSSSTRRCVPLLPKILPQATTVQHVIVVGATADLAPAARPPAQTCTPTRTLLAAAARLVRLARAGRALGRRDVLHERHDRQPQGRRLQPPLELPALDGGLHGQRHRAVRARTGCCRSCRCSTPTRGGCRTPRSWPARPGHAGPVPAAPSRWSGSSRRAADGRRRGPDDLERRPASTRRTHGVDLSSLRLVPCGGSAVPRGADGGVRDELGVRIVQAWGMTETSPLARGRPPAARAARARRVALPGHARAGSSAASRSASSATRRRCCRTTARRSARSRSAARGSPASYYKDDDPAKFHDGWLRTGDVGHGRPARLHHAHRPRQGRHQVRRRVDLLGRPGEPPHGPPRRRRGRRRRRARREVGERPLASVVLREGARCTADELREFLAGGCRGGSCRSGGASSTRCRRPAWASSTRRIRDAYAARRVRGHRGPLTLVPVDRFAGVTPSSR